MTEKNYIIKLYTCGPVHIGSGEIAGKKDYVYNYKDKTIEFLNIKKFIDLIMKKNLYREYEDFILNRKEGLYEFIKANKLLRDYKDCVRYRINGSNLSFNKKERLNNINLIIKDPYFKPFIPGSSLKGTLIHNLLYNEALKNREKISREYFHKFKGNLKNLSYIESKLKKELEESLIGNKNNNIKNIGQLISIEDSSTIDYEKLILTQKQDLIPGMKKEDEPRLNKINLIRESIPKGEEFTLHLKLKDSDIISLEKLENAIENTFNSINKIQRSRNRNFHEMKGLNIYLGSGVGFISKTLLYGAMDINKSVESSIKVLEERFKKINRVEDKRLKLAPKTIKEVITREGREEAGICRIEFQEL
ncbi:MAG: type III-A CRISPR-associated RAMP protein Csm5 [Peptoniphilaceae bacterium]